MMMIEPLTHTHTHMAQWFVWSVRPVGRRGFGWFSYIVFTTYLKTIYDTQSPAIRHTICGTFACTRIRLVARCSVLHDERFRFETKHNPGWMDGLLNPSPIELARWLHGSLHLLMPMMMCSWAQPWIRRCYYTQSVYKERQCLLYLSLCS